jgi:hypothetical protein
MFLILYFLQRLCCEVFNPAWHTKWWPQRVLYEFAHKIQVHECMAGTYLASFYKKMHMKNMFLYGWCNYLQKERSDFLLLLEIKWWYKNNSGLTSESLIENVL